MVTMLRKAVINCRLPIHVVDHLPDNRVQNLLWNFLEKNIQTLLHVIIQVCTIIFGQNLYNSVKLTSLS